MYQIDEPKYLYLLIAVPLLVLLFLYNLYWKKKKQREFGDLPLVRRLMPERSLFKQVLKFVVVSLALVCLFVGLANPKIGTKTETVKREGIDVVFAVDVSKSMLCEDVAPSRIEKSKQIVSQIINQLAGDRVGIIAYAASAFPVLPITSDYAVSKMFLQSMNTDMVSSQGTSLGEAIGLSKKFFEEGGQANKLLILISDGEDHEEGVEEAAKEAKKAGIKIITIGVGTSKGGPIPIRRNGRVDNFKRDQNDEVVITRLNAASLQEIASIAKGGYVNGNTTRDVLDYVGKALDNIEKTEFETEQFTDFNSQFQLFLALAFLLLFLDIFFLERKTAWVKKLNLFNEEKK